MANIYTGIAVIDRKLQIARADELFYEYIGSQNYASVAGNVHAEDIDLLKKTVDDLEVGKAADPFVIRMENAENGAYHHVLVQLQAFMGADGQESFVEMRIQDIDQLADRFADICDENELCNEFLELWGEKLFIYNAEKDLMQVFNGGNKNRVFAFRGTFEEFRNYITKERKLETEYTESFREFCGNVLNGVKNFEGKLAFGAEAEEGVVHFLKGRTSRNSKGEQIVFGYLLRRNRNGSNCAERIQEEFETDVTTGLLTKKAILNYTENLLHRKPKYNVNLCIIDIDNFKAVNDTLGHMFGDEVLAKVSGVIKEAVKGKGIVGRIGGDEIFVVLEGINNLSDLRGVLRSIRNDVEWAYMDRKEVPKVTCSIGVSTYPTDSQVYDDLFQIADKMLYRAKQKGKNRYIIYMPDVHGDVLHGETEAVVQNSTATRQDKEDLVLKYITYMAKQINRPLNMWLGEIGMAFALDEIRLIYGEDGKTLLENFWSADNSPRPYEDDMISFVHEENFGHLYREHDMAVIDKLDLIEQLCPQTFRYMTEHGVRTALVYRMDYRHHEGYIAFYKKSDMSRKWSDSDLANLAYISKILELAINDR